MRRHTKHEAYWFSYLLFFFFTAPPAKAKVRVNFVQELQDTSRLFLSGAEEVPASRAGLGRSPGTRSPSPLLLLSST